MHVEWSTRWFSRASHWESPAEQLYMKPGFDNLKFTNSLYHSDAQEHFYSGFDASLKSETKYGWPENSCVSSGFQKSCIFWRSWPPKKKNICSNPTQSSCWSCKLQTLGCLIFRKVYFIILVYSFASFYSGEFRARLIAGNSWKQRLWSGPKRLGSFELLTLGDKKKTWFSGSQGPMKLSRNQRGNVGECKEQLWFEVKRSARLMFDSEPDIVQNIRKGRLEKLRWEDWAYIFVKKDISSRREPAERKWRHKHLKIRIFWFLRFHEHSDDSRCLQVLFPLEDEMGIRHQRRQPWWKPSMRCFLSGDSELGKLLFCSPCTSLAGTFQIRYAPGRTGWIK